MILEFVSEKVAEVDPDPDPRGDETDGDTEQRAEAPDRRGLDDDRAADRTLVGSDHTPDRQLPATLPDTCQEEVEDTGHGNDDHEELHRIREGKGAIDGGRMVLQHLMRQEDLETIALS